jgi:hypothetical protein
MKKAKKIGKIVLLVFISVAFLLAGLTFAFRERLLAEIIAKVITREKARHQLSIEIKQAQFSGISKVKLAGISVVPENRDTLIRLDNFEVGVSIFPLLLGNIKIYALNASNGLVQIVNQKDYRNFDFLLKNSDSTKIDTSSVRKFDLAEFADNIINELLYKVPKEMLVENVRFQYTEDKHAFHIDAKEISIQKHVLHSTFLLNDTVATWHAEGSVFPEDKKLDVRFYGENKAVELPFLQEKFGLTLQFDTISTRMDKIERSSDQLGIYGNWTIRNLLIAHPRIAEKDVRVERAAIDCNMLIAENSISIDSSSIAYLGAIRMHPFIKYTLGAKKVYELQLHTEELDAQSFFNSFPRGLFNSVEGIKLQGSLAYHLNFYLDEASPWKCKFNSSLDRKNFAVLGYGNVNFQKINGSFYYTPYEYGRPMRSILVGPENPNFVPYAQISDFLKNAILTSEDPLFFSHRGFYMEAFRQSIATNFVSKKFKRGGSTISMQLVKNVFLSRNKTVARKLEEMIIVWLIENNRLSSKQRMFEVYLNIIEWAPNVYGVSEAAQFYFAKPASKLNLGESIFLASIVPKPKKFKYSFLPDGKLKPYMHGYFKFVGGLMVKRGKVSDFDTLNMYNSVVLRGSARNFVLPDSLQVTEPTDEEMESLKMLLEE